MRLFSHLFFYTGLFFSILFAFQASAQVSDPLISLHFNNTLEGEKGEIPQSYSSGITYQSAIADQGVYLGEGQSVVYLSANNITSSEGTLMFWIKPSWNGNDNEGHVVLQWGYDGGMLFCKDGANNWRCIFNRFAPTGSEQGTAYNVSSWLANHWYHAAFTWDENYLKLYINGSLAAQSRVSNPLPSITDEAFQLGSNSADENSDAVLDDLAIYDKVLTLSEIENSFISGLSITSFTVQPSSVSLLETWWKTPVLTAETNIGTVNISPAAATWVSTNESISIVDTYGRIRALAHGGATLTASLKGYSDDISVDVSAPVLSHTYESIDEFLSTPAAGYSWEIPVLIIRYFPSSDGINIDNSTISGSDESLAEISLRIKEDEIQTKFMLEEGSKYHGYKDAAAIPSLGYRVVDIITVYEVMPQGYAADESGNYLPDFNQILDRFGGQHYIEDLGVKEVWLWGYHDSNIVPVESNMSCSVTGDISNSNRNILDLPVYSSTYTLYNYNITRSQNESVHNHGHQLEAILGYINDKQDGNDILFEEKFCGRNSGSFVQNGRCGNTHFPPNATSDYDYLNLSSVLSDCEDWNPAGSGTKKNVNASTWGNITYNWPAGTEPSGDEKTEAQYYIYWMQNMPGAKNVIPYDSHWMTNWWAFTGDWDAAITTGMGLYSDTPLPVELTSFTAAVMGKTIELNWKTATEVNNYGFEVERAFVSSNQFSVTTAMRGPSGIGNQSASGLNPQSEIQNPKFEKLGFVLGAGNSNSPKEYQFTDDNPPAGKIIYRLKQIDNDGNFEYSQEKEIDHSIAPVDFSLFNSYPNPANPSTTIKYGLPSRCKVELAVFNMLGQRIALLVNGSVDAGFHEIKWDGSNICSGIYFYSLNAQEENGDREFKTIKKMIMIK